jgi:type I restriction enzyme, S subunit
MLTFPKHESYRDSGLEWLGEIPNHWSLLTLRAITDLKSEKNRPDLPVLSVYREYGVLLKDSRDDNHNVTSLDISNYKVVEVGDLVVNKMKAWQGSMGISEHQGIVSPAYITCRVDSSKIFPKFLHYLLRSQPYTGVYNALSYGVRIGQWDMHYEDFKKIPLPIPNVDEQRRIVEFLDRKTSEIDQAIAQKQRLIELLQEQKAILINRAVTRGLNPDVPMRDSGVEWIGEIPESWKLKRVKNVSSFVTSGPRGWAEYYTDEGSFFLQSGNLNNSMGIELGKANKVQPPNGAEGRRTRLRNNDVLVCVTGANTGRVAIAKLGDEEVYINQHLCLIRPTKDIYPDFLSFCLHSAVGQTYFFLSQYGLKEGLGLDDVKNAVILKPPLDEQKEITKFLSELIGEIDRAEVQSLNQIDRLNELKSTFIAEAVTGKIRV